MHALGGHFGVSLQHRRKAWAFRSILRPIEASRSESSPNMQSYLWGYWVATIVLVFSAAYGVWTRVRPRERWFPPAMTLLMVIYSVLFLFSNVPFEVPEIVLGLGLAVAATIAFWRVGDGAGKIAGLAVTGALVVFFLFSGLLFNRHR